MLYLILGFWLSCSLGAILIWTKDFDQITIIPLALAILIGPIALLTWGALSSDLDIVIWKRKNK